MKLEILKEKHKVHYQNMENRIKWHDSLTCKNEKELANMMLEAMIDLEIEQLDKILKHESVANKLIEMHLNRA